ncbi:MAG: hypothetical protein ACLU30_16990 [Odoribacter splanchnicus]
MSNTGITLVDVRQEAMDAIRKLKSGDIDVKTAGAIKDLLNTVVDTAKHRLPIFSRSKYNKRTDVCE